MDAFKFLMKVAKANYSTNHGVIVNLRSKTVRTPISLCMSSRRNKGKLIPTDCVVWKGESIIYEGPINSKRLANKLAKLDLCCAEITNAVDMEHGPGEFICMGDYKECKCITCQCRADNYYTKLKSKYPELNNDVIIVENAVIKDMITNAFKTGFKEARARFRKGVKKLKKGMLHATRVPG